MSSLLRRLSRCCCLALLVLCIGGRSAPALALSEAQLRTALSACLADSALRDAATSCQVVTLPEGDSLYSVRAERARIPASQVKLVVSATAVELFGPGFTYASQVWAEADPDGGVLHGDLVVQGYADPIATGGVYAELARQVRLKGVRVVEGDVVGTAPLLLEERDAGARAAQRLRDALSAAGVTVRGRARCATCAQAPSLLARHTTLSLADYLRQINKESVNSEAERLLGSLLACFHNPAAPDPRYVLSYWAQQGQPVEGLRLVDGSGLSRDNRLSASLLVGVLRRCALTPEEYQAVSGSFPVAGRDGTLADRMRGTAAEGVVRAKTGTLPNVSCLSGYVESGKQPRVAFSLMMNGFSCPVGAARRVQDQMAATLARYVREKWG